VPILSEDLKLFEQMNQRGRCSQLMMLPSLTIRRRWAALLTNDTYRRFMRAWAWIVTGTVLMYGAIL